MTYVQEARTPVMKDKYTNKNKSLIKKTLKRENIKRIKNLQNKYIKIKYAVSLAYTVMSDIHP